MKKQIVAFGISLGVLILAVTAFVIRQDWSLIWSFGSRHNFNLKSMQAETLKNTQTNLDLNLKEVEAIIGQSLDSIQLEEFEIALESVQTNIDLAKTRRNIGDEEQAYILLADAEATANDLIKSGTAVDKAEAMLVEIATIRDDLDKNRRRTNPTPPHQPL